MAIKVKRILCPVDFEDNCIQAVETASELGVLYQARVYFLHVITPVISAEDAPLVYPLTKEEALTRIKEFVRGKVSDKTDCEMLSRYGLAPAQTIIKVAEDLHADLIVIATHGRGVLMHLFLGSVAERVVRESPVPVLTLRPVHKS